MPLKNKLAPLLIIVAGLALMMAALAWALPSRPAAPTTANPATSTNTPQAAPIRLPPTWTPLPTRTPTVTPTPAAANLTAADMPRVSLADAKAAFDAGTAIYVDVRSANAYAVSHIAGALSIPEAEIASRLGELDANAWIIPY